MSSYREMQQKPCPKCGELLWAEVTVLDSWQQPRLREDVVSADCPNGCVLTPLDFRRSPRTDQ